jgi:hypothetical protein
MTILYRLLFVALFVFSFTNTLSQTKTVDSLLAVLAALPPEGTLTNDTTKVLVLCALGKGKDKNGLFVGNYEQCIKWLDEAEKMATKIKWTKGLLLSNLYAGVWHSWKGN